ncbi:GntR family transcriptional regulator [Roseomonas gilardii]|uniref:GntR family transcriptional regulator n=1 Tax=Roseomonas gilardii TaxID=257708 RepID=A0A1L7ALY0_9PROT|nr:GntR family transcriptional regulator [Roseomonas gilardii]APT59808.1 GntR family transcriptional regulator [Roseomonas gilardii]MDT8333577.1 GntR family transcriptional regulator [Roseomonas gilardii]
MSQSVAALLKLREVILSGSMPPGERLSENGVAERLGASRTPVRAALARLAEEGLLEPIPSGGFMVKAFTEREIRDAIEVRGTLEGLAARFAAERGASPEGLAHLRDILEGIDAVLARDSTGGIDFTEYVTLNEHFHQLLLELADSPVLARKVGQAVALPFASPSGFVMAQGALPEARVILTVAQEQHRSVVEAISLREGARAEAIMREHARLAHRNLALALRQGKLHLVQGGALIQRRLPA